VIASTRAEDGATRREDGTTNGAHALLAEARIIVAPGRHPAWRTCLLVGEILWIAAGLQMVVELFDPFQLFVHDAGFWIGDVFAAAIAALFVLVIEQVRRVLRGKTPVLVARRDPHGAVSVTRPPLYPVQPRIALTIVGRTGVGYITAPRASGALGWWTRFALVIASPEGSIGTPLPWALDSASIDGLVAFLVTNGIEAARADANGLQLATRSSRARRRG
jgi:hypothetical protein